MASGGTSMSRPFQGKLGGPVTESAQEMNGARSSVPFLLARVLRRRGRLFHWTGAPNSRSRGRDLAAEVVVRLRRAGFGAAPRGDGVLAVKD